MRSMLLIQTLGIEVSQTILAWLPYPLLAKLKFELNLLVNVCS